jgi:hypothetical protein
VFMIFMAVLIVLSSLLLGGRLGLLAELRLRSTWLILTALAVQILITDIFGAWPRDVLVPLHLASYVCAGVFLWANRRLPGLLVIGFGSALNASVIALNGGTLPASARALEQSGVTVRPGDFQNSDVLRHPILPWLGDILATPSWLPLRNVISIGDMIILGGAFMLLHAVTQSWLNTAARSILSSTSAQSLG